MAQAFEVLAEQCPYIALVPYGVHPSAPQWQVEFPNKETLHLFCGSPVLVEAAERALSRRNSPVALANALADLRDAVNLCRGVS